MDITGPQFVCHQTGSCVCFAVHCVSVCVHLAPSRTELTCAWLPHGAGTVKLKDLEANEEVEMPLAEVAAAVRAKLSAVGDRSIIAAGRGSK